MVMANYGPIRELAVWNRRVHHSHSLTTSCPNMELEVDTLHPLYPLVVPKRRTVAVGPAECHKTQSATVYM